MARNVFDMTTGVAPNTLEGGAANAVHDIIILNEGEGTMEFTVNYDASWTNVTTVGHAHREGVAVSSGDRFFLQSNEHLYLQGSRGTAAGNIGAENIRKTRVSPASVVGDAVVVLVQDR